MPVSTEQLMHEQAYFGTPPDVPSEITLPKIPGTVDENNFGEFGTRLFIFQHTRDQDRSIRASNGWDGDRYALVKTPAGNALVWATVWDTPGDAAEFMSAIDAVMAEAVLRQAAHHRRASPLRRRQADDRRRRSRDRAAGRSCCTSTCPPARRRISSTSSKVKVTPR